MKLSVTILLLFTCLFSCKMNEFSKPPEGLEGKWKMVSSEVLKNGATEWEDRSSDSIYLFFSKYGEVINSAGYLTNCGPSSLRINGKLMKIKFHAEPANDLILGLCAECPTWNIDLKPSELILNRCSPGYRMKFIRD